jgi:membrane dipeptidase
MTMSSSAISSQDATERAARVHSEALVWDNHAGFAPFPDLDLSFLERWLRAGASFVSINVGFDTVMTWEQSLRCAAHFRRWLDTHNDKFILAERVADVQRAKREEKLAVAFDLEGANALNKNIDMITVYYQIGVRQMLFAYNKNNDLGGGCLDEDIPLTSLGQKAVTEMNRVGMMIDCSHAGYTSSMEIMEISRQPVIFSHSNPRTLWDHPRNILDDQIKACARSGGVVGINGVGIFLGENNVSPALMARHIEYVVDLAGIDHVGIGVDSVLDPQELPKLLKLYPDAWPDPAMREVQTLAFAQPEQLPKLTEELLNLGYGEDGVKKILGGNFLRVAAAVWR